jgi:hypothetical protein
MYIVSMVWSDNGEKIENKSSIKKNLARDMTKLRRCLQIFLSLFLQLFLEAETGELEVIELSKKNRRGRVGPPSA